MNRELTTVPGASTAVLLMTLALSGPSGCQPAQVAEPMGGEILDSLTVVSTPNPNVFPLLLALAQDPDLPVRVVPVSGESGLTEALESGRADAMVSMTYVAAKQVVSGRVPDLQLHSVAYWSGFFEVAVPGIETFQDLKGKRLVISGPVGNGKGGGPDIIFQAAMKREGLVPGQDFHLEYLPLPEGIGRVTDGEADAILLAEPAATGLSLQSFMTGSQLRKSLNIQQVFTGFDSWESGQVPLGGLSARAGSLTDPGKLATFERLRNRYMESASRLMAGHPADAQAVTERFNVLFGDLLAQPVPASILVVAVARGGLVYRSDLSLGAVRSDLDRWIVELLGASPGEGFYAP